MPHENDEKADQIDVKNAIRTAKAILADLLEGEAYNNLGLEEVSLNPRGDGWEVTLGYNRPWDVEKQQTQPGLYNLSGAGASTTTKQVRTFKKIKLDSSGAFISMSD